MADIKLELILVASLAVFLTLFMSGCASFKMQAAPNPQYERQETISVSKKLLIFFDGTANQWNSRTNVRRLFEMTAAKEDPKIMSLYLEGVGTSYGPLTGGVLGYGMKPRILEGYKFLSKYYKEGDKIYIFGFSRGAHQARTLAGLLAYNGLPEKIDDDKDLDRALDKIWDFCRAKDDLSDHVWKSWNSKEPILASDIRSELKIDTKSVQVEFLGIWDTVPGSQFKKYGLFGEQPDSVEGMRYKIQPYPTIKRIAHAVALDEKRSKFRPVLVRPPIDPARTKLEEVWFAGAHADVGGGYDDSNDLAGISLNWMLSLLQKDGLFTCDKPVVFENAAGLAHWSIDDKPANAGSKKEDRIVPEGAVFDPSIAARKQLPSVPVRYKGNNVRQVKYDPQFRTLSASEIDKIRKEYESN